MAQYFIDLSEELCRTCLHHPESSRLSLFPFSYGVFHCLPRQLLHRTKRCYRLVLRQQRVCAPHLLACPHPPLLLPKRCQQRPSRPLPSFPSLQTAPRRGRRTSVLAQRVSQVRASSRPSWICSPTPLARWSSLRMSPSASFTAARPSVTVVSQPKRNVEGPIVEALSLSPCSPFSHYAGSGPLGHPKIYINLVRLKCVTGTDCSLFSCIGQTWLSSVRVS